MGFDFCRDKSSTFHLIQEPVALLLKFLYNRGEVDWLVGELAVLGDFGLVQHFESVPFKEFGPASAIERYHLGVHMLHTLVVEKPEIGLEQLAENWDTPGFRKQIDMEMANPTWCSGNFVPSFGEQPMDVLAGFLIIPKVAA